MDTSTSRGSPPSTPLRSLTRFALLWCSFFVAILVMAGLEGVVLWHQGVRYTPASSLCRVWACNVSIDANGGRAAAIVTFKRNSNEGCWRDVALLDFRRGGAVRLGAESLQPKNVSIAPGGDAVAIVCGDGSIYSMSGLSNVAPETGMPRPRLFARPGDRNVARVVFSPDGSRLATIGECFVTVWLWPDGTRISQRPHSSKTLRVLAFSEDSTRIVSPGQERELCVWDANSGQLIEANTITENALSVVLSPDWQFGAVLTSLGCRISVHRLADGEKLWHANRSFSASAFDHEGQRIAFVSSEGGTITVDIRDAETGLQLSELCGHDYPIFGLTFSPDDLLCSWDSRGHIRAWNVEEQREQWSLSLLEWAGSNT